MSIENVIAQWPQASTVGFREAFRRSMDGRDKSGVAKVSVFLTELEPWACWMDDATHLLDQRERTKVASRLRPQDVRMLITTYALHRLLLAQALGITPEAVPIGRDALGCPVIHGHDWITSISHCEGLAAFAISSAGPVGVDIEPLSRQDVMPEIRAYLCHASEQAEYPETSVGAKLLLALWVRKEALLKAAGVGLGRNMTSFRAPDRQRVCLEPELAGELVAQTLDAGGNCLAAVASRPDVLIEWEWFSPLAEA